MQRHIGSEVRVAAVVAYRQALLFLLGGRCRKCGTREHLEIHHLDGDTNNNHPSNLQPLCVRYHPRGWRARLYSTPRTLVLPPVDKSEPHSITKAANSRSSVVYGYPGLNYRTCRWANRLRRLVEFEAARQTWFYKKDTYRRSKANSETRRGPAHA